MMINIHSTGGRVTYGVKHYDLDTFEDLKALNKNGLTPGSTIFIIASSKYYMLNGSKKWVEINPYCMAGSSGGNSGGSGNSGSSDNIYDGGSIDESDPF